MTTSIVMIPVFLEEKHEPIDWKCANCGHSWKKHKFGKCSNGMINKCSCAFFRIDQHQLKKIKSQLEKIKNTLFEDLPEAERLEYKN